jgi:hypothetical protein
MHTISKILILILLFVSVLNAQGRDYYSSEKKFEIEIGAGYSAHLNKYHQSTVHYNRGGANCHVGLTYLFSSWTGFDIALGYQEIYNYQDIQSSLTLYTCPFEIGFCAYLNDIKFSVGCGLNAFQSIVESNSEDGLKTSRSSYIDFSYYAMFNYGVRFGQIIISPEMKFSVLSDARIIALTPGINISYLF